MKIFSRLVLGFVLLGILCVTALEQDEVDDVPDMDVEDAFDDEESEEKPAPEESASQKERPTYKTPVPIGATYFVDTFDDSSIGEKWLLSQAQKEDTDESIAKYNGVWSIEEPTDSPLIGDQGLVLKSRAKHHAISAKLDTSYEFRDKAFIVQFEVKFQNGQECGGAYVKLLTDNGKFDQKAFADKTPYTIMFGPDKCGNDNKLHFIFRHKNPITGEFEEKHAKKPSGDIASYFTDKKTHLYTLILHPDNTFEIFVDQVLVNSGSLLEDFEPPVNPPKEITDPNDKKPANWDEREKIPDPDAVKPDDWDEDAPEFIEDEDAVMPDGWLVDEPEFIPDPDAEKPSDWDEDMDGEWEAPQINNPKCESAPGCGEWKTPTKKNPNYKGKWRAPMIDNPDYQGKWKPKMIPNPDFFEDMDPFSTMTPIAALGLELWSMSDGIYFDNFIVSEEKAVVDQWAAETWELKSAQETSGGLSGKSVVQAVLDATKERPWLWAVFILVVVLPIVLVIAYCCMSGPSKPDAAAQHKKTDEGTEADDVVEGENESEEAGGSGDAKPDDKKKTPTVEKKSSKGALEADEAEEADAEDEEEKPTEKATPTRTSPRKRKPQKE